MVVYIFFEGVYVYSRRMFDHHRVFFFSSIVEILRNWFFLLLLFRLHFPLLCRGIFIDSVSLSPFFFLLFLYADSGVFIDFVLFTSVFFFFRLRNFIRSAKMKIEIFFQSFVASGLTAESTLLRNEERSEILRELRPNGSRFLSHFWKEIRAE